MAKNSQGSFLRLLNHEQRISISLDRISSRFPPGCFVWVSADATLEMLGVSHGGSRVFFRTPVPEVLPLFRPPESGRPVIGACE